MAVAYINRLQRVHRNTCSGRFANERKSKQRDGGGESANSVTRFGTFSKVLAKYLWVYFLFGKILIKLWQKYFAIGPVFIVVDSHILKII